MPFLYASHSKQAVENQGTSGSTNTELDQFFLKPGASRPASIARVAVQGKGAGLTALSGISIRLKRWTTTASTSTGATSTTPTSKSHLAPACVATAGMATALASSVSTGTGGPLICGYASMGASGPGGSVAINPDDLPQVDGGATMSMDLFSASGTASLPYEFEVDHQEC